MPVKIVNTVNTALKMAAVVAYVIKAVYPNKRALKAFPVELS
jgi:hypothetical protein